MVIRADDNNISNWYVFNPSYEKYAALNNDFDMIYHTTYNTPPKLISEKSKIYDILKIVDITFSPDT